MQSIVGNALAQTSPQPYYQLSENFQYNNTRLFKGIEVKPLLLYADTAGNYDISEIRSQHAHLNWKDAADITPQANIVYWLKCNIVVNESISGKQIFQVAEELGNDLHAYDYIETYSFNQQEESAHQRTGRQIDISIITQAHL